MFVIQGNLFQYKLIHFSVCCGALQKQSTLLGMGLCWGSPTEGWERLTVTGHAPSRVWQGGTNFHLVLQMIWEYKIIFLCLLLLIFRPDAHFILSMQPSKKFGCSVPTNCMNCEDLSAHRIAEAAMNLYITASALQENAASWGVKRVYN